uniref:Uncharacterized protein n=1 Tax=Ditylenchus dipsaci TaxID=166011 RepID=A0A915CR08_9BILA
MECAGQMFHSPIFFFGLQKIHHRYESQIPRQEGLSPLQDVSSRVVKKKAAQPARWSFFSSVLLFLSISESAQILKTDDLHDGSIRRNK